MSNTLPGTARSHPARIVSVSSALFDGYDMTTAVETIGASSATHVEPAFIKGYVDFDESAFAETAARRLRDLIAASGTAVHAVSAHMDLGTADAPAMLARRIRFAAQLGARFLITNAGPRERERDVLRCIDGALALCEDGEVVLALENPGHGADDLVGTGTDGAALVGRYDSAHLRLNHDAGNLYTYSGGREQPAADLARCLPAVAHAHLKDVGERGDDWVFGAIGDGVIDYDAYWRRLPAGLPLSIELPLRLRRAGRSDPRRAPESVPLPEIVTALERSLSFVARKDINDRVDRDAP